MRKPSETPEIAVSGPDGIFGRHNITEALLAALKGTPLVLLDGPQQSGRSTLARWPAENKHKAAYFTLDDAAILSAVTRDADAFLRATFGPTVIDEVQLAPVHQHR
ncbi:MAG: hypothetical protein JSU86_11005 [Phycisphaerales bacterium]|nr:MAG: hypothetical protein JSU86_11005 [Phycisphaerales bacterium]